MSGNIRTLDSLRGNDSGGEDSDDERKPESFFVGGGRDSGQQVMGPGGGEEDEAARIMHAARRAGAEVVGDEGPARRSPASFNATGYRLGGHGLPSQPLGQSSSSINESEQPFVSLNLWTNGFSIDDGPLRSFEEPQNRQFMTEMMQGKVPAELAVKYGPNLDLRMKQKGTEYVPPKAKPFSGQGHVIGGGVHFEENINAGAPLGREEKIELEREAEANIRLNESEPVTRIMIRFPDNERIATRFNHTHRVEDIRNFIVTANPNYAYRPFQFTGGFPIKPIEDEKSTLKEAGLINAMVTVKFI
ncbi:hypothetical protein L596_004437 [Steinernema carpocapsae]|uniref:UBX domain-containing protein n=1 Tax=Steinernema carpocapsae TaxID=34508 RepID=A0A4U8UWV0_STECR|nr:hypothetical protein L596_004437 [Steinernema carpocapsae]